ncbi:hypothetical protein [Acidianus sp. RZ1]|uniref:InlB B-repeat-containing protein n=1 Tax=Acidianus sp. RZ1 TaxID=1540082 RepID=UPI0014921037|nr:hypothetical protein [Acidianus sp. RZ1]NON62191.1 hypothetical protein [Acidianus sp. RZ1]
MSAIPVNITLEGNGIILISYLNNVTLIDRNTTINLPNTTIYLEVYGIQAGSQYLINGNCTSTYFFNPITTTHIIIKQIPDFVNVSVKSIGNGSIILRFSNGTTIHVKNDTVRVIAGQTIMITAKPSSGYSFYKWNDNTSYPVMYIMPYNSTCLIASFTKTPPHDLSLNLSPLLGIGVIVLMGIIYYWKNKRENI